MNKSKNITILPFISVLGTLLILTLPVYGQQLTFEDVMKFEDISDAEISDNGKWIAYSVWPDRGDGEVRVQSTDGNNVFTIDLGDNPRISNDGRWVAANVRIPLSQQLKKDKDKPKEGLGVLNTANGEVLQLTRVASFKFSNDSKWLAVKHHHSREQEKKDSKNKHLGTDLTVMNLESGDTTRTVPFVSSFEFDSTSTYLAYSIVDTSGSGNGLYVINLDEDPDGTSTISTDSAGYYSNLSWDDTNRRLAFTAAKLDKSFKAEGASLQVWSAADTQIQTLLEDSDSNDGYTLRSNNDLTWSSDGKRLFFGFLWRDFADMGSSESEEEADADSVKQVDIYDQQSILKDKGVDVWHWNDPRIKTYEKNTWSQRKNHLYRAVYHLDEKRWVQLADREVPDVSFTENPERTTGQSRIPYLKLMTWEGFFSDHYVIDLRNGSRKLVAKKLRSGMSLSPGGSYALYYKDKDWHLYDVDNDLYRNLTENIEVPFYNEDHDYPYPPQGYGTPGWVENDKAVLINDKYDIWKFSTENGKGVRITGGEGRKNNRIFRIQQLDPEQRYFVSKEELLLQSYHDKKKNFGFYTASIDREGIRRRLEEEKKYDIIAKADDSDTILFTQETYSEYPNLWISDDKRFNNTRRISELHLNLTEKYDWGTAELVEWNSLDGLPLQGVLIKPGNFEEGKKYPVLIYYYRFFSQRLHDFNVPRTNHRPVFAQYASDGYLVFLPDIKFDVGTPGSASTKSLVPGVQQLIEMGIADPDGLGLHGHSWSGYQTAFMITETDIFDAAVAGAPVSNMTSAYSGIRWGSGLARQFQYEETQSRIGGSLWEYPERYIENSPVFYADRINTPLLIQFGDEDGAVPWYQGIELYLAMRRLGKDAVFLQYHGEPHHLQKFPNKLDYAIKMKEYFDHYLRGKPAPDWIREGIPYRGKD